MGKRDVVDRVASVVREIVSTRYSDYIVYVYLFGSHVEGRATRESDVDVAIRFYSSVPRRTRWRIIKELLKTISEDIDIVDLEKASIVLRMAVYRSGKLIYCRDNWILFLDQNKTLKLYNDWLHISKPYYKRMVEYFERRDTKEV